MQKELLIQVGKYLKREQELPVLIEFIQNALQNANQVPRKSTAEIEQQSEEAKSDTIDPSFIVDIIMLFDWDLEGGDRELLNLLVKELCIDIVPRKLFIERLETQMLLDCNLIDGDMFNKKLKRVYTDTYFTVYKYTLFREQSQGYSKLISEIFQAMVPPMDTYWNVSKDKDSQRISELRNSHIQNKCRDLLSRINKLIGCYMLDPTRVLDVVLDLFSENVLDNWYWTLEFFILFLEQSDWAHPECHPLLRQLITFKLKQYKERATPRKLIWMIGILIKHKLLSIEIFDSLTPNKSDLQRLYKDLFQNLKGASRFKRKIMVGELAVEGRRDQKAVAATVIEEAQTYETLGDTKLNQKASLIEILLALGEIEPAKRCLSENQQFLEMYKSIGLNFCRVLNAQLSEIYLKADSWLADVYASDTSASLMPLPPPQRTFNTRALERITHGKRRADSEYPDFYPPDSVFFYSEWDKGLSKCKSLSEFILQLKSFLPLIGVHLAYDPLLFAKLLRISIHHLSIDNSKDTRKEYLKIIVSHITPSLSLLRSNPAITYLFWNLLSNYSLDMRFGDSGIYAQWERIYETPLTAFAASSCSIDMRYITGRISEDVKDEHIKNLAKVIQSNPVLSIERLMDFMASKPNVVPFVAEAVKYFTPLDIDVLTFCLLRRMMEDRTKVEGNGTTFTEMWKNLSKFAVSALGSKSSSLKILLKYLSRNDINDLLMLGDLIAFSSGVQWQVDLTDDQIYQYGINERKRRTQPNSGEHSQLSVCLNELGSGVQMALSLAQDTSQLIYKQSSGYDDSIPDSKIISWQLDLYLKSFLHFFQFILEDCEPNFLNGFPSFQEITEQFGVQPALAFYMIREPIRARIAANIGHCLCKSIKSETDMDIDSNLVYWLQHPAAKEFVDHILQSKQLLFSPEFYATFWLLSVSDLPVDPVAAVAVLSGKIAEIEEDIDRLSGNTAEIAKSKVRRFQAEFESLSLQRERIGLEIENRISQFRMIKAYATGWFEGEQSPLMIALSLLQECFYPRAKLSLIEATFSADFLLALHSLDLPGLPFLSVYSVVLNIDKIFEKHCLTATIFSMTVLESKNFGFFLNRILKCLNNWTTEEGYLAEIQNHKGFKSESGTSHSIELESFRNLVQKWFTEAEEAFISCISSSEYTQAINAMVILDKIEENFPAGFGLIDATTLLSEIDERGDVKLMAGSLSVKFEKKAIKLGKKPFLRNLLTGNADEENESLKSESLNVSIAESIKEPEVLDPVEEGQQEPEIGEILDEVSDSVSRNSREVDSILQKKLIDKIKSINEKNDNPKLTGGGRVILESKNQSTWDDGIGSNVIEVEISTDNVKEVNPITIGNRITEKIEKFNDAQPKNNSNQESVSSDMNGNYRKGDGVLDGTKTDVLHFEIDTRGRYVPPAIPASELRVSSAKEQHQKSTENPELLANADPHLPVTAPDEKVSNSPKSPKRPDKVEMANGMGRNETEFISVITEKDVGENNEKKTKNYQESLRSDKKYFNDDGDNYRSPRSRPGSRDREHAQVSRKEDERPSSRSYDSKHQNERTNFEYSARDYKTTSREYYSSRDIQDEGKRNGDRDTYRNREYDGKKRHIETYTKDRDLREKRRRNDKYDSHKRNGSDDRNGPPGKRQKN